MLNKAKVTEIQADLSEALKAVAKKHNLTMSGTKVLFSAADFKLTANFGDKESTGGLEIDPVLLRNLTRNGFMFGLDSDMAVKQFNLPGMGKCELHGLRGKFAVVKNLSTSKMWKYDARMISAMIANENKTEG
jgi:hypothetical protein